MYSDITYSGGKHETTKQTNTNVLKPHTRAMYFTTIALFSVATVSALSAQDYMSQLNKRPLSELAQSEVDA